MQESKRPPGEAAAGNIENCLAGGLEDRPSPNGDQDIVVAEIAKNSRERIRILCREFRGHRFVDLRLFFQADDGSIRPTPKGVSIRANQIDQVVDALIEAKRLLERAQ